MLLIIDPIPRLSWIVVDTKRSFILLFFWDLLVTFFYYLLPFHAPELPLTIFGSILALFLGFRANSAYQRWWEGRILWGQMVNCARNLIRLSCSVIPSEPGAELTQRIARLVIAYVNLVRCQLRRIPPDSDIATQLGDALNAAVGACTNGANRVLLEISRTINQALQQGLIDTIQQCQLESIVCAMTSTQGGMERIKSTPLPNQYRFYPKVFTRLCCILLPIGLVESLGMATPIGSTLAGFMFLIALRIGDDLTDPFANTIHDLPLNSLCRTIEIDLCQAVGFDPPPAATPVDHVLW